MCADLPLKMNFCIVILLLFSLLGAVDKILKGRLGVADAFDQGLNAMGGLCFSMAGIYCIGITSISAHPSTFSQLSAAVPFDISLLVGVLLAPDLGGYSICTQLAASPALGLYAGLLISSTVGCTISFVLPTSLGSLPTAEIDSFMKGISFGIITVPVGVFLGGLLLGIFPQILFTNLWPVLLLCCVLCLCFYVAPKRTIKALTILGDIIRITGIVLFCIVAAEVFVPAIPIITNSLVNEVLVIVLKITIIVSGSMVASQLVLNHFANALKRAGQLLGINEYAVIGLFISLATSISMLPMFSKMDRRGKVMNAAFTVSGAFVLGGQLAFVSSVQSSSTMIAIYMITKIVSGISALALAAIYVKSDLSNA
jgi:ethanolamine transporter